MGCQPLILGYADPDKSIKQLKLGSTSLMNKLEVDMNYLLILYRTVSTFWKKWC